MKLSWLIEINMLLGLLIVPSIVWTAWTFWPYQPVLETAPPQVIRDKMTVYDLLQFERYYCVYTSTPATASRSLVSHERNTLYNYPTITTTSGVGCHTKRFDVSIPDEMQPGRYILNTTLSYQVNPIRVVAVQLRPVAFEIVP